MGFTENISSKKTDQSDSERKKPQQFYGSKIPLLNYVLLIIYCSSKISCYSWMAGSAEAPESADMPKHSEEFLGLYMKSLACISTSPIFFKVFYCSVIIALSFHQVLVFLTLNFWKRVEVCSTIPESLQAGFISKLPTTNHPKMLRKVNLVTVIYSDRYLISLYLNN